MTGMRCKMLSRKKTVLLECKPTLLSDFVYGDADNFNRLYNTTLRGIIPLPDMSAPPDSASHLNAYPEFATGSTVMALYPDTSCFYRAEVIESPTDLARVSGFATFQNDY